jgi:hypothetical protein
VIVVAFSFGIQLVPLGVVGVGRTYDEFRHRPEYVRESPYGWDD